MIGFKKYWYGKECEGRLTDVETLFIADISAHEVLQDIKAPHIYFCSGAVQQIIEGKDKVLNWGWLVEFIDRTNVTISLEVNPGMLQKIPHMVIIKTHIMYMITLDEIRLLKENDSVKLVHGPYNLYCTSIQNMQKVTPDDYKYDRYE